jgi:hypothetical protein
MKVGDLRRELESYGVATKSFFEKSELTQALREARAVGQSPTIRNPNGVGANNSNGSTNNDSGANNGSGHNNHDEWLSRDERIRQEMTKTKTMKVGELKQELEARGVSTKSFFEKTEFVRAYAEAIVDGTKKKGYRARPQPFMQDEPYDSSYRDVIMDKIPKDSRLLQGTTIVDTTVRS